MPSPTATAPVADLRKRLIVNHKRHHGDSIMPWRITSRGTDHWRVHDDETGAYSDWFCRPRAKRMTCLGFRSHDGERVVIDSVGNRTVIGERASDDDFPDDSGAQPHHVEPEAPDADRLLLDALASSHDRVEQFYRNIRAQGDDHKYGALHREIIGECL